MTLNDFKQAFFKEHPFLDETLLKENNIQIALYNHKGKDYFSLCIGVLDSVTKEEIANQYMLLALDEGEKTKIKSNQLHKMAVENFVFTKSNDSEDAILGIDVLKNKLVEQPRHEIDEKKITFVLSPIDYLYLKQINKKLKEEHNQSSFEDVVLLPPCLNINDTDDSGMDALNKYGNVISQIKNIFFLFPNTDYAHDLRQRLKVKYGETAELSWFNYGVVVNDPEFQKKKLKESDLAVFDLIKHGLLKSFGDGVKKSLQEPIDGIWSISDLRSEIDIISDIGLLPGYESGFPSLDKKFTIYLGDFTVVTGVPGHGKSTLINNLIHNYCRRYGWKAGVFSPESKPKARFYIKLMEMYHCKPIKKQDKAEKDEALEWIEDSIKLIAPDKENLEKQTFDGILDLMKKMVRKYGTKLFAIDPWNHLYHGGKDMDQGYISQCTTKLSNFCEEFNVHVFLTTHPNKMQTAMVGQYNDETIYRVPNFYDISGSAMFANKAGNILTVYRFPHFGKTNKFSHVLITHIQKLKREEAGDIGKVLLLYRPEFGAISDSINSECETIIQENYDTILAGENGSKKGKTDFKNLVQRAFRLRKREEDLKAYEVGTSVHSEKAEDMSDIF